MSRLNKSALINEVAERTNSSKASTERFITALQDVIMESVSEGKEVKLTGFASFTQVIRLPRIMKNPKTGLSTKLPEIKTVRIRPLKKFRSLMNNDESILDTE